MDILDIARKNQQKAWEIIKKINVIPIWEGSLYRHQKIQDQSDINDNCLRNCRPIILLNDE